MPANGPNGYRATKITHSRVRTREEQKDRTSGAPKRRRVQSRIGANAGQPSEAMRALVMIPTYRECVTKFIHAEKQAQELSMLKEKNEFLKEHLDHTEGEKAELNQRLQETQNYLAAEQQYTQILEEELREEREKLGRITAAVRELHASWQLLTEIDLEL